MNQAYKFVFIKYIFKGANQLNKIHTVVGSVQQAIDGREMIWRGGDIFVGGGGWTVMQGVHCRQYCTTFPPVRYQFYTKKKKKKKFFFPLQKLNHKQKPVIYVLKRNECKTVSHRKTYVLLYLSYICCLTLHLSVCVFLIVFFFAFLATLNLWLKGMKKAKFPTLSIISFVAW